MVSQKTGSICVSRGKLLSAPLNAMDRSRKILKKSVMSCRFVILHVIDNHDKNSFIIKNGGTLFEIIHDASKKKKGKN